MADLQPLDGSRIEALARRLCEDLEGSDPDETLPVHQGGREGVSVPRWSLWTWAAKEEIQRYDQSNIRDLD